ncbi:AraC family transcriptional regulator [Rhodococcus sp. PAMC28707]|uniref:AraC family transcriptional regulator n=1 Tax=unclassified Rhodococcus (in: high G+C Gram-positive bacteria) TaxID=192944 RepID=UPI00109E1A9B|nr:MULTISPECIES: AraC family transcriptional regulator [unclassified Rhodococcus (in: high G+C Gram-positive bacteria)]QCB50168.1 AraC family transcriptional regulator [Rhodococcus sp. PAMC28705]QCB58139.1 AraC family transcriptional regulator [Rhodococcus sp. PAMC28707]
MTARTIPVAFVVNATALAASSGVDLSYPLSIAGIGPETLKDPRARLTAEQVTLFTQSAWQITGDELFGLASTPMRRGSFRVICQTLIHSPDLASALNRMTETTRVLSGLPPMTITRGESTTRLTMPPVDNTHLPEQARERAGQLLTDFRMLLVHRFAAWLIGGRVKLHSVELPYDMPDAETAKLYDRMFGTRVAFGASVAVLEFDNAAMRAPIVQTEASLTDYLRESPNLLFTARDYDSTASSQVRRALELGLQGRSPCTDEIAAKLTVSTAHLRRLLRQEGTSVNQIREEVLRDAAISGLSRGDSVDDLSHQLGFSEPSAFRRAFKRWTGQTPGAYR